jgi:hypothetical protein
VIYRNEVSVMLVFHMAITKRRRMDVWHTTNIILIFSTIIKSDLQNTFRIPTCNVWDHIKFSFYRNIATEKWFVNYRYKDKIYVYCT